MRHPTFWHYDLLGPNDNELNRNEEETIAEMFLLISVDILDATVGTVEKMWSKKPLDETDGRNYKVCAKTGLKVPVHMQAQFRGKYYDRRWCPTGPDLT